MSDIVLLLQTTPLLAYIVVGILGLCVGSFLNVVIYRTPKIMEAEWDAEVKQYVLHKLSTTTNDEQNTANTIEKLWTPAQKMTLSLPRSHCPTCSNQLSWYENIPLLSWLWQRAKCRHCSTPISVRYPIVEALTSVLSMLVLTQYGVTGQLLAGLVLVWSLIALAGIDFDTQLLPDRITLPLAALGLLVNTQFLFSSPIAAIWGYVLGFLSLWTVYFVYKLLTGKVGMGHGDFKLLAALGAWLGASQLPLIILLSSLIGALVGVVLLRIRGQSYAFAFGPYIAIAGIVSLLWGKDIMRWYLSLSQITP